MSSSNSWKNIIIPVLIVTGLAGTGNIIWKAIAYQRSRQGFTSEQIHEAFRKSEERDRENWEKMWKDAGKKAPAIPNHTQVVPRDKNPEPSVSTK